MRTLRLISFFSAPLLLLVGSGVASAAFLSFDDTGDVVNVVVDNNFECGVSSSVNGENAHVDGCWITNSPNGYSGTAVAYMVEPAGNPDAGAISDEIHIQFDVAGNLAHMSVDFLSDTDGAPLRFPPPGAPVIVEDGTSQFLNLAFYNPATGNLLPPPDNIEMRATSDVEQATPTVPTTWSGIKATYR